MNNPNLTVVFSDKNRGAVPRHINAKYPMDFKNITEYREWLNTPAGLKYGGEAKREKAAEEFREIS